MRNNDEMRGRRPLLGFTLIELSIVLVIIGLIVGGVLVGRDLIETAKIRAQITQIEKFNTAVHTFKSKYNGLPGDLSPQQASQFGMFARAGGVGDGDGNGLIESLSCFLPYPLSACLGGESVFFWTDLSYANLIDGNFTRSADSFASAVNLGGVRTYLPQAKLRDDNSVAVYADGSLNYFQIAYVRDIAGGQPHPEANLTPIQMFSMDTKIDDGLPLTGTMTAMQPNVNNVSTYLGHPGIAQAPASGVCVSNATTPASYNTANFSYAATPACTVRMQLQ